MSVRNELAQRMFIGPIIRRLFPAPEIPDYRPTNVYIIEHPRLTMFHRDPFQIRPNAGDPRSDWGTANRAWRFRTEDQARYAMESAGVDGTIRMVPFRRLT
jgi:hypothetical protein